MSKIFDTHIHFFDLVPFNTEPYKDMVAAGKANGVGYFLNVGCDLPSSRQVVSQATETDGVWAGVGFHPNDAHLWDDDSSATELEALIANPKTVAIGEIGLDLFRKKNPLDLQIKVFEAQIKLAIKHDLPVLLHIRDAYTEAYEIVKKYPLKGLVHCFSSDPETVLKFLSLGFYISFSGTVTFKNATNVQAAVRIIPLEKILVETDAPFLAPVPYRGQKNKSQYINETIKKIAKLKNIQVAEVIATTTDNARSLFGIFTKI